MATFEYQALTSAGRMMTGTLESATREQAEALLAEMKLTVHSVEMSRQVRPRSRLGRSEFLLFNQQLASITKAGVPLERGLREVVADIESRAMRKHVADLAADLEAGTSIEEAFEKRRNLFPPLYGHIVQAGIRSGRLTEMLTSLNHHLEVSTRTRRIVFEAMAYPLVVLFLAAVMMTFVLAIVVPQMQPIYEDLSGSLPLPTQALLFLARNLGYLWLGAGAFIGVMVAAAGFLAGFPEGRRFKEAVRLRVPILGRVLHRSLLARLSDAMAMLVEAGCDMPACLRLASSATGSETMRMECEILAGHVERGENVIDGARLCRWIPALFAYSMQIGSQRNELQNNLHNLSDMYTRQIEMGQSQLQAILLPTMLLVVGGFIFAAITAMFMPVIAMIQSMTSY